MSQIQVNCPYCQTPGNIDVPDHALKEFDRGVKSVSINKDIVCSHEFIAYFDRNLDIRDYFLIDFRIKLPEIEPIKIEQTTLQDYDLIDVDLIKLNMYAPTLFFILNGAFFKKRMLIINNKTFLHNHLINFFKFIFRESFETEISIETYNDYKINKKNYKDILVFDDFQIIKNKKKLLKKNECKIEKSIIQKFFSEHDAKYCLITLRDEIRKAYILAKELSKKIIELIKIEGKEKIAGKNIVDDLTTIFDIKISLPYLVFLIDIAENYFDVAIPEIWKFFLAR